MTIRKLAQQATAAAMALLLTAGAAEAQKIEEDADIMNYFGCHKGLYMYLDGGMQSQNVKNTIHDYTEKQWSPQFRAGFQYFYKRHLGIGAGISYSRMSIDSMALAGYTQQIPNAVDELDRTYEHHTYFGTMSEQAVIHQLSVPAMLLMQSNMGISWKIYAGAGAMFTLYPKATYSTRDSLETRAYYSEWDLEAGGIGHNTYKAGGFSGKYQFNPNLSVMAELGIIYAITPRLDAYLCATGHYRLTPMPEKTGSIIYNPDCMSADAYSHTAYNGILSSEASPKLSSLSLAASLGIRFRISGEAKLNAEEYQRHRQAHQMMDSDIKRMRRADFDRMEHRRHAIEDSVEQEELERHRRQMRDSDVERQKRIQDSLQNIIMQDSIANALADTSSQQPDTRHISPADIQKADQLIKEINSNYCAFNEANIETSQKMHNNIDQLAQLMVANPDLHITIVGHTCNIGTMNQNKIVGMRRAEAFRKQLTDRGVDPKQTKCETKWFSEPLVPNTSEENRAKNRRVQLIKVIIE